MMNILVDYMEKQGHSYMRMDGTTPVQQRIPLIDKFNSGGQCQKSVFFVCFHLWWFRQVCVCVCADDARRRHRCQSDRSGQSGDI